MKANLKAVQDRELKLTLTMLEQIQTYVDARDEPDRGGWYYGNREQFEKRHNTIKQWLAQEIYKARCNVAVVSRVGD